MSKEQVAELLGVSVATLLRWHHSGKGPPRVKIGRQIYYHAQAVEDFMRLQAEQELRSKRRNGGAR
jgi:excisionase family DNA binding protein